MDLIASTFIKPYSQTELAGAEGLTHEDIAKSLTVRPIDFKNRFFELGYDKLLREMGLIFEMFSLKSETRGRPKELLVFPTDVARILVANYPNEIGMGYAAWLVQVAHHQYEAIAEDNARLRNENQTLAGQAKKVSLPRAKRALTRRVLHLVGDLIGGVKIDVRLAPIDSLVEWQKLLAHVPAMIHQKNTLAQHVIERVQAATELIGNAAEALGVDRKDVIDTIHDALYVMSVDKGKGSLPN